MLLAVFSDIHANRQAFDACLKAARARGAERFILLGDFVGYGADPEWVVDTVMELVAQGAIAIRGNHDQAVGTPSRDHECRGAGRDRMDPRPARRARSGGSSPSCRWRVRGRGSPLRPFRSLQPAALALCPVDGGCRAQHDRDATPMSPSAATSTGRRSIRCRSTAKMTSFVPTTGRSGAAAARAGNGSPCSARSASRATAIRRRAFVTFDTETREITYCRVPYDVEAAAKRIRDERPAALARRSAVAGEVSRWPKPSVQPGAVIDGFTIGECVHRGGMATLWSVTHPGIDGAAADEDPAGVGGRGPRRDRLLRDGADDPAAAVGSARAGLFRHRRFRAPGLCRDRAHSGHDALQAACRPAAAL